MEPLIDMFGRTVQDVRISVTDRCNFRCTYCMPEDYSDWVPRQEILTFEEMARLASIFAGFGVQTIRLTGGEPLMRRNLSLLVSMLRELSPDIDLSLTTNGFFLRRDAADLARAGLGRINVSLDSLKPERFAQMTRRDALGAVLEGLAAASCAGLDPIKVNVVAIRGCNDDEILDLAGWARDAGYQLRFIEFMPLDGGRTWTKESVFGVDEILSVIASRYEFEPVGLDEREPASRYVYSDGGGEFGIIGSVTKPFCSTCDRIRVTADGQMRTCLFALTEFDLKTPLRSGATDDELAAYLRAAVLTKGPGHNIGSADFVQPDRAMVAIGG